MAPITVSRSVKLPDLVRLERYRRVPELGPSLLFFSGGSALKQVSKELTQYTKNSIHLLTPFDSGGSSAILRQVFGMPAVGDIRSRLMALADQSITGNPEVYELADFRLARDGQRDELLSELEEMLDGKHALVKAIPNPLRRLIRLQLRFFVDAMPNDFDLRGASIGNLILTGGYLNYQNHLDPILYLFSKLLAVQGLVRPITDEAYNLAIELGDGSQVIGQHLFTGKEHPPINCKIKKMWLSECPDENCPVEVEIDNKISQQISTADLICYPPGSFYSSVIANLLPKGVGDAVAENAGPKVYIPNLGKDPEQFGMTLESSVTTLLDYLHASCNQERSASQLLDYVLLDSNHADYRSSIPTEQWERLGIKVIDTKLIDQESSTEYDPALLTQALLSLT